MEELGRKLLQCHFGSLTTFEDSNKNQITGFLDFYGLDVDLDELLEEDIEYQKLKHQLKTLYEQGESGEYEGQDFEREVAYLEMQLQEKRKEYNKLKEEICKIMRKAGKKLKRKAQFTNLEDKMERRIMEQNREENAYYIKKDEELKNFIEERKNLIDDYNEGIIRPIDYKSQMKQLDDKIKQRKKELKDKIIKERDYFKNIVKLCFRELQPEMLDHYKLIDKNRDDEEKQQRNKRLRLEQTRKKLDSFKPYRRQYYTRSLKNAEVTEEFKELMEQVIEIEYENFKNRLESAALPDRKGINPSKYSPINYEMSVGDYAKRNELIEKMLGREYWRKQMRAEAAKAEAEQNSDVGDMGSEEE